MVFGLVISGFEVIKNIEGLKTDSASRPYADVRVIDCGQLITKSANDGKLVYVCKRPTRNFGFRPVATLHCLNLFLTSGEYFNLNIGCIVG